MLTPRLVSEPSEALIPFAEAKVHLRLDGDDEDSLVAALISAATSYLDGWSGILGRCLITQTWAVSSAGFARRMAVPLAPVQLVSSIGYFDTDGVERTLSPSAYRLHASAAAGPYVEIDDDASLPSVDARDDAVTLTFVAGYGAPEAVPMAIRQAALLLIGHWYENRGAAVIGASTSELPLAVVCLLAPYRRVGV